MQRSLLVNPSGFLQETDIDENLIINGNFEINQTGVTSFNFSANSSIYTIDQWVGTRVGSGVFTLSTSTDVPTVSNVGGFPGSRSLRVQVTTAQTTFAAGDYSQIQTRIEGYRFRSIVGKPFTVSFWVKASKPGVYCLSVRGGTAAPSVSYVVEYTINQSNVWERKSITIPAVPDEVGTWNYDIGMALVVEWTMASGTNFRTATPNSWISGQFFNTSNAVNILDTVGNTFQLALVKLEPGIVASSFKHFDFETQLSLCRRYYTRMVLSLNNYSSTAGELLVVPIFLPSFMRITPTASLVSAGTRQNLFAGYPIVSQANQREGSLSVAAATVGNYGISTETWEFNARM